MQANITRKQIVREEKARDKGFHTDRIRVHAKKQMVHRRVPRKHHTVNMLWVKVGALAHFLNQRADGFLDHGVLKPFASSWL